MRLKSLFYLLFIVVLSGVLTSCGGAKKLRKQQSENVVAQAKQYLGTPYAYGGTSRSGMDCSGLVMQSFPNQYSLPRTAKAMSKEGKRTKMKKLKPGDLVFFKTGRGRKITHVGIVVSNNKDYPEFIHSSTSRGVIISSLGEAYWRKNFRKARRIIH
ncbi:C40 family peptidase [Psychroflexus planctonicus]|uniref:Lipoprotein n=1 Tax=Psychroflexus planctonicus TaxID=1526575 RepID=A0ABQ1SK25_9FLAO|nr:C40 family peptidase [Psychroflexus planctonicus]GGE40450.1 lipoprotein [Psychroflexus planctonicus]